jgi:hypothetical protein
MLLVMVNGDLVMSRDRDRQTAEKPKRDLPLPARLPRSALLVRFDTSGIQKRIFKSRKSIFFILKADF